jgi:putative transposase
LFQAQGWRKPRRLSSRDTPGAAREVRSYEAPYVGSLWHWDGHTSSRAVLTARGEWITPVLIGVIDDRSRLACHLQWYSTENAEYMAHSLSQAIQKRGLPRAGLSDNGQAMLATEITEGLARLGIVHDSTRRRIPFTALQERRLFGEARLRLRPIKSCSTVVPESGKPPFRCPLWGNCRGRPERPEVAGSTDLRASEI